MKEYTVDCEKLVNPEATHTILAEIFAFPPYYGRNLDALYDCLTALPDCRILLQHTRVFRDSGAFARAVLSVFEEAAEKFDHIRIKMEP